MSDESKYQMNKCYKCNHTDDKGMAWLWFLCEDSDKAKFYTCCPEHAEELAGIVSVILPERYKGYSIIYEHTWTLWKKDWHKLPEGGQEYTKNYWHQYMAMKVEDMSNVGPGH